MIFLKTLALFLTLYLLAGQITSLYAYNNAYDLQEIAPPVYSSQSVVLIEANTGMILYQSGARDVLYPASITKIMTALIVLEQIEDLSERVEFSNRAVYTTPRTSSHIAMNANETLSVYEALYGLMLASANEVSLALAEHVAGSIEEFVELMNRRAYSLGAYDTYFVNPSGLPADGQVTTAYDFALIMREAVRHPMFVDIISARRFDIPPTERKPEIRMLRNTNELIHPGPLFNPAVIGSKTGWTTAAGHTLVTYAQQDGRRLIVSVLGGTSPAQFNDTTTLLNYGFSLPFIPTQIFNSMENTPTVPVYQQMEDGRRQIGSATLRAADDIYFDLPSGFDISQLRYNLSMPQAVIAPVQQGDDLGRITIYIHGVRIGDAQLLAAETVREYHPSAANMEYEPSAYTAETYSYASLPEVVYYAYESSILPAWIDDYLPLFAIPLAISLVTLLVSLLLARRRKRSRRMLHARYARYPEYYRYR